MTVVHRVASWLTIGWTAFTGLWFLDAANNDACPSPTDAYQACEQAHGIVVAEIFGLWIFGLALLAMIWFATRPKQSR